MNTPFGQLVALNIGLALLPFVVWYALAPIFGRSPTWNIMRATAKESVRQPVYFFMLFIVIALNVLNTFLPFFTLGDDVKILKDGGLTTILFSTLLLAIWTSSTSIADEIEGKTAMTLLSKPINRRQFIVGKYLGILYGALMLFVPVVIAFTLCIYYKVFYDGKENSAEIDATIASIEALQVVPGLILIFLEVMVVTAISVAISTRLPMVVNVTTCLAIFVIGHLSPAIVHAGVLKFELVEFMAKLIATILPALESFNISAAISTGAVVPTQYVGFAAFYAICYSSIALLAALIMFEDRDLA